MTLLLAMAAGLVAFRLLARIQKLEFALQLAVERLGALESKMPKAPPSTQQPIERPVVVPAARPTQQATPRPLPPALRPPIVSPEVSAPSVPPPVTMPHIAQTVTATRADQPAENLETRIGSRWLLYVGVVAIIVGVSYFEKLAFDNHWVGETTRVIQGALSGLVLIAAGLQFVRRGYRAYGQVLSGSGVAVLYVSTYAAFNFYHLIGQPTAFMLMTAVTALAAWLADRQRSQSLALVAVGGGFATPFLLPSAQDAQIALFGYDTFLIAGTMYLSRRRDWPALNVVSYAFTVMTFGAWASQFYIASKYLPTEFFLTLFCAMYLFILHQTRHSQRASAAAERLILGTAPFAYYVASLTVLWPHAAGLLIFLVVLAFVGAARSAGTSSGGADVFGMTARRDPEMRLAFWLVSAAPLLMWSAGSALSSMTSGLAAWAGVYTLTLAGLLRATLGTERRLSPADVVLLHLNGMVAFAGVYVLVEPAHLAWAAPIAAAFAVLHGAIGAAAWNRQRETALHFIALAFTLLTAAIALQFDGAWITCGWAAEGAVVMWLGLGERRDWLRRCGLALFAIATIRLLALQFAAPRVGQLLLINRRAAAGLFVIALTYLVAYLHNRMGAPSKRTLQTGIALVAAKLLLLALAASEISAYWSLHSAPPFARASQIVIAGIITGVAIVWMALVRQQEWMRRIGGALVALAAFALFALQLEPAPIGHVALFNLRAFAGLFAIATFYGLARLHQRRGAHVRELAANIAVIVTAASLLSLSLLTSEINAFFAARGAAQVWSMSREALQALAWAGVGGFLVWHGLSNRRAWIRVIGAVLLVVGLLRLLSVQFADAQPGYLVLANPRMLASIAVVLLLYGLATLYRDADGIAEARYSPHAALLLAAHAVTLALLTSEITAYWQLHDIRTTSSTLSTTGHLAREMMLSITWALYATLLIVVGLRRRYAPIRYFAISVFVVTIAKVFAIDLAELDRIYRVLSVIGLGVMLLVTSYLYQHTNRDAC